MSEPTRRAIKLTETKTVVPVSAKYLLWFAWAPPGLDGPEGDKVNGEFQPIEIDVEGISQVTVTADPDDLWSHHPGNNSNAGGIDDERGLENPAYQSPTYNSEKIQAITARLNLLVGMLATEDAPAPAGPDVVPFKIGLSRTIPIDDINATRLFLAFHDGREWSNNEGTVNITVTVDSRR